MLTTAVIAFREFLEAFLLVGIFLGINKQLHLGKTKEILLATSLGITISLLIPCIVFFFAGNISHFLNGKNIDILEGYLLTFSGVFLAYVVFSLHNAIKDHKKNTITNVQSKMEQEIFDMSLFLTIVFFIAREGFEVALLIATTSLFSVFWTNIAGLILGFFFAFAVSISTLRTYLSFSIGKVFRYTEYLIIIIGAAMVMNGISMLLQTYTPINLATYLPLPLQFLPSDTSVIGHLLKNIVGIQKNMSIIQVVIMLAYIGIIYFLFLNKKQKISNA